MKRFFGMMPSDEIKKEEHFKDKNNLEITIQAGENGWSILYADGGSLCKDDTKDTEDNFKEAYNEAIKTLGELTKVEKRSEVEVEDCYEEG